MPKEKPNWQKERSAVVVFRAWVNRHILSNALHVADICA